MWRADDLAVGRAGRWPKQQARREYAAVVREQRVLLAGLSALTLAVNVIILRFATPFAAGLTIGVLDASIVWSLALLVVQVTGGGPRWMGGQAEEWSAFELRSLRGAGWRHLDHVLLQSADADHVAIGPAGVFALETKWTAQPWRANSDHRLPGAAAQARRSAQAVRSRLRAYYGVVDVTPVVVLWGHHEDPSRVVEVDGVTILHGTQLASWLRSRPVGRLSDAEVEVATTALSRYMAMRDQHEAPNQRSGRFVEVGALGVATDMLIAAATGLVVLLVNFALWANLPTAAAAAALIVMLGGCAVLLRRRWPTRITAVAATAATGGTTILCLATYAASYGGLL